MAGGGKYIQVSANKQRNHANKVATKQTLRQSKKVRSIVKPKRVKARITRILKDKESKLIENTKNLLILRGNKTNEDVNTLLRDFRMLKAPYVKMMGKKNDIHVFDDINSIEFLTQKNDTSLFMIGSSTKKRPNNLVLGRTFDGHLLDMMELGYTNYKSITSFTCKSKKAPGSRPCFIFTGDEWESREEYQKLKNLLIDIFRGTIVSKISIKGLDHVIVCTAFKDRIFFRSYTTEFKKVTEANQSNTIIHPRVDLIEMGPRMDFTIRRTQFASRDLMKIATKQPVGLVPKKVKNISHHELTGDKVGRIHLERQDVYNMQTRRVKALRKTPGDLSKEHQPQDMED